jgi:hypothetical protein
LVVNSVESDIDDDEFGIAIEAFATTAFATTLDIIRRFVSSSTSLRNCCLVVIGGEL